MDKMFYVVTETHAGHFAVHPCGDGFECPSVMAAISLARRLRSWSFLYRWVYVHNEFKNDDEARLFCRYRNLGLDADEALRLTKYDLLP